MVTAPDRKYALTRIKAGDYLLPSNDRQSIWRIATYEDGPSHGLEDMPRDRKFWGVWRWSERVGIGGHIDTADWSRWEFCCGLCESRNDAINEAMRLA